MRHDELQRILEETTNQEWDRIDFSESHLRTVTLQQKQDVLILIDETKVVKTYVIKKPKTPSFDLNVRQKLQKFVEKSKIKDLIPTIQVDLDYFQPITGTIPLMQNRSLRYSIKPSGKLTLQSVSSRNRMVYNLSGTLSSKIEANSVLNDFISDLTAFTTDIDLRKNEIKFNMKRSLKIGPAQITFKLSNFNEFNGTISLALKRDEIIYKGWKFTGDMALGITGSLQNNDLSKTPEQTSVYSTQQITAPKANHNTILLFGGFALIGAVCIISGGTCIAALGLGGIGGSALALTT